MFDRQRDPVLQEPPHQVPSASNNMQHIDLKEHTKLNSYKLTTNLANFSSQKPSKQIVQLFHVTLVSKYRTYFWFLKPKKNAHTQSNTKNSQLNAIYIFVLCTPLRQASHKEEISRKCSFRTLLKSLLCTLLQNIEPVFGA